MTFESNDHLAATLNDDVLTATLCRPEAGNAIDRVLAESLLEWARFVEAGAREGSVRVAVMRNEGFAFSVGGDFAHFGTVADRTAELAYIIDVVHEAQRILTSVTIPTLSVVDGVAAGGGLGLALTADIVVGTPATRFKTAYVDVALSPDCGSSWLLTHRVGGSRAMEMFLLNRVIDASQAYALGLVGPMTGEDVEADVAQVVQKLSRAPRDALATTKRLVMDAGTERFHEHLNAEAREILRLSSTSDAEEASLAFTEKRPPVFG